MDWWAVSAVIQMLDWIVVAKRELSLQVKLSIYFPNLAYDHEVWIVTERIRSHIQAVEMSFLHRVSGLTLRDRVRSSEGDQSRSAAPLCQKEVS